MEYDKNLLIVAFFILCLFALSPLQEKALSENLNEETISSFEEPEIIYEHLFSRVSDTLRLSYIQRFLTTAKAEELKFGIPASITLSQALYETRAGTSSLAEYANNHFGIRYYGFENIPEQIRPHVLGYVCVHDDCKKEHLTIDTEELDKYKKEGYTVVDKQTVCKSPNRFVKYDRPWASFRHHSLILLNDRYQQHEPHGYKQWAVALRKGGYASYNQYDKTIVQLIESLKLYQYDGSR